jgi:uncharacterized protein
MKQKIGLFLCLALLLTGCSYQTKTIRFGAADIGGMYYTVANAYAGLASKESSDLKFEVKNTAGSAANLRLLSGNYIDLGIAQADLVRAAHEGTGSFSDNRQQGYRAEILYRKICKCVNFDRCRKCRHRCCPETVYKPLHHQNSKIHDRLLHLLHDFLWHT